MKCVNFLKRYWYFLVLIVVLIGIRFYQLGSIPFGLNFDELALSYDSYLLAHYGYDRNGIGFTFYLTNYGNGASILYTYLNSLLFKVVTPNAFTIRMLQVTMSIIAIIVMTIWLRKTLNKFYAFVGLVVATFSPIMMFLSRLGIDCNLALPMTVFAFISLYYFIVKPTKHHAHIAGLLVGLALYAYVMNWIPLFLFVVIMVGYSLITKKIKFTKLLHFLIPLLIVSLPLFITILVNLDIIEPFSILGLNFTQISNFRSSDYSFSHILSSHQTLIEVLFSGDWLSYNSVSRYPNFADYTVLFAGIGLVASIYDVVKKGNPSQMHHFMMLVWTFCLLFTFCLLEDGTLNCGRCNAIYFCIIYFTAYGIGWLIYNIHAMLSIVLCGYYVVYGCMFFNYYFNNYNSRNLPFPFFSYDSTEVIDSYDKDVSVYTDMKSYHYYLINGIDSTELTDPNTYLNITFDDGLPTYDEIHSNSVIIIRDFNSYWINYYDQSLKLDKETIDGYVIYTAKS